MLTWKGQVLILVFSKAGRRTRKSDGFSVERATMQRFVLSNQVRRAIPIRKNKKHDPLLQILSTGHNLNLTNSKKQETRSTTADLVYGAQPESQETTSPSFNDTARSSQHLSAPVSVQAEYDIRRSIVESGNRTNDGEDEDENDDDDEDEQAAKNSARDAQPQSFRWLQPNSAKFDVHTHFQYFFGTAQQDKFTAIRKYPAIHPTSPFMTGTSALLLPYYPASTSSHQLGFWSCFDSTALSPIELKATLSQGWRCWRPPASSTVYAWYPCSSPSGTIWGPARPLRRSTPTCSLTSSSW
jgi:hypothetical protein